MSEENVIHLNGDRLTALAQRAVLVPIKPRDQAEAAALPAKLAQLNDQAAADNHHVVIAPTHLMMKGDEIVGYLSLNGLPTVQAWFDSHHKHAADSLKMIEHGETVFREAGVRMYAICCAEESPFTPHMDRLGFKKLGTTVMWIKQL